MMISDKKVQEICRSLCEYCRQDYASVFNTLMGRWEHPYAPGTPAAKLIPCEATALRDNPI